MILPVDLLGQSGCRFQFSSSIIYIDPYLSDSVEKLDSPDAKRLVPVTIKPEKIVDADIVFITHDHIDHCDPFTLPVLAEASPNARFIGPSPVLGKLSEWGIDSSRLVLAREEWVVLSADLKVYTIPAAHPEIQRDEHGNLECVGYLFNYCEQNIYVSGDTSVRQEIIDIVSKIGDISVAFLPVNESNFFRDRRGIIGNMSVRDAFTFAQEIDVQKVVPVHWDMFAINSVDPDEMRLVYKSMSPNFSLHISPKSINVGPIDVSIIIRTLNESLYLNELLVSIANQKVDSINYEVIVVDSGSTDGTLKIAEHHGCKIVKISRSEFSFGRALNFGCEAASGSVFAIISGHCVPNNDNWLHHLCNPILDGSVDYTYGRQIGGPDTCFSEQRIFTKYFQETTKLPQDGFYCNNANSALSMDSWYQHKFNENLTGLEDMELAQRITASGGRVGYIAEACVYHYHNETWPQVKKRFEREAIALQCIMPQVHVSFVDTLRYILISIIKDWLSAKRLASKTKLAHILLYRWNQYWGAYKGNHQHRKLSHLEKDKYFYPE